MVVNKRLSYYIVLQILFFSCARKEENNNNNNDLPRIISVENYSDIRKEFEIYRNTTISIQALGEGFDSDINPSLIPGYHNDNVEVYFDLNNEKDTLLNLKGDNRHYIFSWNIRQLDGININNEGVKFVQKDLDIFTYLFEIKFSWKSLGYVTPEMGKEIGFDLSVGDNDSIVRDALINWGGKSVDIWRNPSLLGTLILVQKEGNPIQKTCYSAFLTDSVKIDGIIDEHWNKVSHYKVRNVISGKVKDSLDVSASFKVLWDKENLYLLVIVKDDIKNKASTFLDHGWLEDTYGRIIWSMNYNNSKYAGGSRKNRIVEDTINLNPGKYYLRYVSDESHSWNHWDSKPPNYPFYGIILKKSN